MPAPAMSGEESIGKGSEKSAICCRSGREMRVFLCYFFQKARDCSRKFVILQMFPRRCFTLGWSGWVGDDIMDIGVFWRLGFDSVRTSQTLTVRQKQGNEDAP